jgi:excisionase family DNA binding protein
MCVQGVPGVVTDRLLTTRELASQLGVSTGALLRWARRGEIPAVKLPSGAIRFVPAEVDAWLAASHIAATGAAERGVSPTYTGRARSPGYARPSLVSPNRSPAKAARNEEEHDAR